MCSGIRLLKLQLVDDCDSRLSGNEHKLFMFTQL